MDPTGFASVCRDVPSFSAYVFKGLVFTRTLNNLGLCLRARLLDARRKTHQPAGAMLAPRREDADAVRQRLNRATLAEWSDVAVIDRLGPLAVAAVRHARAWIIDDTGFGKQGSKSPGVARQWSGGVVKNCQVVVSTHLAGLRASVPLRMNLYLSEPWCDDRPRRSAAGIPDAVGFETKKQIALGQLRSVLDQGLPRSVVLADGAYGDDAKFRKGLVDLGLEYVVGVNKRTAIWRPGQGPDPIPVRPKGMRGRQRTKRYPGRYRSTGVRAFALELPKSAFKAIRITQGRGRPLVTRFAAVQIRTAKRSHQGTPPGDLQWLLIEWPPREQEPTRYFLSNLGPRTRPKRLATLAKLRWRVERDYQDMKQEVGLTHYEGRTWRGLHHHLTICMAAFAFLVLRRTLCNRHRPPSVAAVRRRLQPQLQREIGHCPSCRRPTGRPPPNPTAVASPPPIWARAQRWTERWRSGAGLVRRWVRLIK